MKPTILALAIALATTLDTSPAAAFEPQTDTPVVLAGLFDRADGSGFWSDVREAFSNDRDSYDRWDSDAYERSSWDNDRDDDDYDDYDDNDDDEDDSDYDRDAGDYDGYDD